VDQTELIKSIVLEGGKLLGLVYFLSYLTKKNARQLDALQKDFHEAAVNMAVMARDIKHALDLKESVESDHDRLVQLTEIVKRNGRDINATHEKIRVLTGDIQSLSKKGV
jgi:hypothetical protein